MKETAARSGANTRRAAMVIGVILIALAAASIARPAIANAVGTWEVQRAYDSLPLPLTWTRTDAPTLRLIDNGGVLLSAVYRRAASSAVVADALDPLQRQGWKATGGIPDASVVSLRRDDLELVLAMLPTGDVRVEVARYR